LSSRKEFAVENLLLFLAPNKDLGEPHGKRKPENFPRFSSPT
jgi:hypothetical protein